MSEPRPIVELRDVRKSYRSAGGEVEVLRGISLKVESGELLGIVGASGNGKSTLLNLLTGIDRPSAGEVIVGGLRIDRMSEDELAIWRGRAVGIVFQFFQLLPALSLLQNVILPMDLAGRIPRAARRSRAMDLLSMVGLSDQVERLPGMVSGGQLQRAAIARALANDPPLVVADEPTGNLDSKTSAEVFEILKGLVAEGKTLVMVTHDPALAAGAGRLMEIVDGRIAGAGVRG